MPTMSRRLALWVSVLMLAASLCYGQSLPYSAQVGVPTIRTDGSAPAIVIGPGDIVQVKVFDVSELSGEFRVSQSGRIDMPLIGVVKIAGFTADEAARDIADKLKNGGFVLHPQITLLIAQYATQGADVMGEVRKPGIYPTLGTRRLLDMLTLAGGVTPSAGNLVTIIHRDDPHHPVYLALAQGAAGYKAQANPVILPGDTIVVQKSGIAYIMGAVGRPGGYLVDNNEPITLMEAITLAGGTMVTSDIKDIRLIRKVPSGKAEIKINLKKIFLGKEADIAVENGDIIYVPTSNVKAFIYQGFNGIASAANTANVAVYASHY